MLFRSLGSEGGRLWLAVAAFLVLAMDSVEALAWGYMGSAFSEDHGWMVAVALGSLVWLVIFGIDYTLITFDSARHHYESQLTLSDQQASPKLPGWRTRIGRSLPYLMRIGFAVEEVPHAGYCARAMPVRGAWGRAVHAGKSAKSRGAAAVMIC